MDVAIASHASWAKSNLGMVGGGAVVVYRAMNEDSWAETAPMV